VKTFVVAVRASGGGVNRLRTYSHQNGKAAECTIIEAARATSAAPTFFAPITIVSPTTGLESRYIDGGVGHNNPAEQAVLEAREIWPGRDVGLLLSIGTGTSAPPKYGQSILGYRTKISAAVFVSNLITECESVHNRIMCNSGVRPDGYFRFNVDSLGGVRLDEWKQLELLNSRTEDYMTNKPDIVQAKTKCVASLLLYATAPDLDVDKDDDAGEDDEIPPAEQALEEALVARMDPVEVRDLLVIAVKPYKNQCQWDRVYAIQKRVHDFIEEHYVVPGLMFPYIKHDVAITLQTQKKYNEAAMWERQAFDLFEAAYGPKNLHTCIMAIFLACYLLAAGDHNEWRHFYELAKNFPPWYNEDGSQAILFNPDFRIQFASVFIQRHMAVESEENIRELWKSWDTVSHNDRLRAIVVMDNVAFLLRNRRELSLALEFTDMALEAFSREGQVDPKWQTVQAKVAGRAREIRHILALEQDSHGGEATKK